MAKMAKGKINLNLSSKSFKQTEDDYLDLEIKGYASTSSIDRMGEYFVSGAWSKAVNKFMSHNPVLLLDHDQSINSIVGQVTSLIEDGKGLLMVAKISNAPGLKDLRWKIAEGFINSVSVGGRWSYDGQAIKEVTDLFEISLVAVPANPEALISTKSFEDDKLVNENKFQLIIK